MEDSKVSRIELPSGGIMLICQEYEGPRLAKISYIIETEHKLPMQIKRKIQYRAERRSKAPLGLIFNPSLLLSGAWMIRAGFCVGDRVTVTVDQGLILITY